MGFLPHAIRQLHLRLAHLEGLPSTKANEEILTSVRLKLQNAMRQEELLWKAKSRV